MKGTRDTSNIIKGAPECDEVCPWCLSTDKWVCTFSAPVEGSDETEFTYVCTFFDRTDDWECGCDVIVTHTPDYDKANDLRKENDL